MWFPTSGPWYVRHAHFECKSTRRSGSSRTREQDARTIEVKPVPEETARVRILRPPIMADAKLGVLLGPIPRLGIAEVSAQLATPGAERARAGLLRRDGQPCS